MSDTSGRILVVDDNEMNRDMLSRRLSRKGYETDVAEDGSIALERIAAQPYDLVLLDIMMPGIDGLEVLARLRETHGPSDLPVVMATAKTESEDIVRALKLGANDYVTKPIDFPVALARVRTQLSLKAARDGLVAAHAKMKADLEAASRMQQNLLPRAPPAMDGLRFAWRYAPADDLAGDILNLVPLGPDHVAFYVLDVCGHGVRAALLSVAMTHTLARKADPAAIITRPLGDDYEPADPADVARRLSQLFPAEDHDMFFSTLVYGVVDRASRELRFTCAGHPGPLRLRADGSCERLDVPGVPIGLDAADLAPDYEYTTKTLRLEPGERLYFYSDGLVEEQNAAHEEFGETRFADCLAAARDRPLDEGLDELIESIRVFTGRSGFADDLSVVAIEAL